MYCNPWRYRPRKFAHILKALLHFAIFLTSCHTILLWHKLMGSHCETNIWICVTQGNVSCNLSRFPWGEKNLFFRWCQKPLTQIADVTLLEKFVTMLHKALWKVELNSTFCNAFCSLSYNFLAIARYVCYIEQCSVQLVSLLHCETS